MGFLNHKETAQQKALDDSARNFTLQQYAYAKEILHHPSLLWDGIKNDVREVAHHPLESAWNGIKSATTTPLKGMRDYGHSLRTQMRVDSHMPVSQKDIDDYGAQAIAGSYHALSPVIGGLAGRGIGEAIEGSMGGIIRHMSDEDLSKLVLLKQGEGVAAHIPPRKLGDQKYGHILERLSIIDNAQPPFGSGNYKPRSGGYHFPPNGAQHPKPYQQLHRALLLGEMDHPFIGNNLPIILREGNNELGNRHMEGGHGNDIRKYYENAVAHGQDVIGNATHLYYNPVTTSFLFVKKIDGVSNNKNVHPTVAVRLDKDHHDHFTVITGYNERWKRIDDGKNQFIKDNADGSGIVRPIDSSPDYESSWHQSQISQAGSVTGSGDHRPPIKGGSSHPTWLHNIGNSEHVKHYFTGLGSFTGAQLSQIMRQYNPSQTGSSAPEVKYHFEGLGSFTASQAQQAHQQYQDFHDEMHQYNPSQMGLQDGVRNFGAPSNLGFSSLGGGIYQNRGGHGSAPSEGRHPFTSTKVTRGVSTTPSDVKGHLAEGIVAQGNRTEPFLSKSSNVPEVQHHFKGLGSFTASQAQQAHQQYQNFEADLHKYTQPNPRTFPINKTQTQPFKRRSTGEKS